MLRDESQKFSKAKRRPIEQMGRWVTNEGGGMDINELWNYEQKKEIGGVDATAVGALG